MFDIVKEKAEYVQFELSEAEQLKKEQLTAVDVDYYLKEQVISLRYQNQLLQEKNRTLCDHIGKVYEFMKQFVIGEMDLMEKFTDWIGEKVRDVGEESEIKITEIIENCSRENLVFMVELIRIFVYKFLFTTRTL